MPPPQPVPKDSAEYEVPSVARSAECFGHRETVGVVLDPDFTSQQLLQIGAQGLPVQAMGIGVPQQTGSRGDCPGCPHAEGMGLSPNGFYLCVIERLKLRQDIMVAMLLLGFDAFSKQLMAAFVQSYAFDLRATEVDADAIHAVFAH